MALMAFGIVRRDEVNSIRRSRKKRLNAMWGISEQHYFSGAYAGQLRSSLEPYAKDLACGITRRRCIKYALNVLADTGLCIVNVRNDEINHWVLAIGIGGKERNSKYRPDWLLILDPSHSTIPLMPWNGLLNLRTDRHSRHAYDTPEGRHRVSIECVVSLRRIDHART